MSFSDPRWLQALLALPVLAVLEWLAARRAGRDIAALVGDRPTHPLLEQVPAGGRLLGAVLRLAAAGLLVVGAAGPEWGREVVRRASSGSDVVLVLDVSASMDARDVPPSRIDEARREAIAVVDRLAGCRVAIVAFAGEAVRMCPLTLDRSAVQLILESVSTASVSEPGTDLGRGLTAALKAMPGGRREEQAIVIWTDGEDLEQGARAAIDEVARSGIRVFTVGVGTRSGDVVPVLDTDGRMIEVKRDAEGEVVRSRLDEDLLRGLARRTNGAYFPASRPGGELPRLVSALTGLARGGRETRLVERPMARFPLFAGLAAVLLAVEIVRPKRRAEAPARRRMAAAAAAAAACAALVLAAAPAWSQSAWARGDRAFRGGRYAEAESLYARRLRGGGPAEVQVNRATARALGGRKEEAERLLGTLAQGTDAAGRAAGYNLGTLRGQRNEFDTALAALRKVLENDPADEDARWNYEVLLRRRQQQQDRSSRQQEPDAQQPQKPQKGGGRGGEQQQEPQPAPSQGNQGTPPPQTPPGSSAGKPGEMSREQADRLLDALDEMARTSPQRSRNVRAVREKRGRDW